MPIAVHPELTYSFRRFTAVVVTSSSNAVLARVEALLRDAADEFAQRRYRAAISLYQEARRLLWNQLFPTKSLVETVAWNSDLYSTLVSYGSEWLNVLPVEQATSGVRPRVVTEVQGVPELGLTSASVSGHGAQAIADLESAELLSAQGNAEAARFFRERATTLAPELVNRLDVATRTASGTIATRTATEPTGRIGTFERTLGRNGTALGAAPTLARLDLAPANVPPAITVDRRAYSVPVGDEIVAIKWDAGKAPAINDVVAKVYEARRTLAVLPDALIRPERESDAAISLAHAWYYETPLGLAESYHALGDWPEAEQWYGRAASYRYLNAKIEAPYVWSRFAALYRDWGDSLFRADDPGAALPIYEHVLTFDGQAGNSQLYTITGLQSVATVARDVIAKLDTPEQITASPAISSVIFDIYSQLAKIQGGLDFWGHWAANVPIWTFDYLQSVAANFCQLAISAERDAMTFWEKADLGQLTRTQLTQSLTLAQAEREASLRQVDAARAERDAYVEAEAAAQLRASNARANAQEYAQKSRQWTMHQALSTQLSGGEDGDASQLNALADRMIQGGYSISGDRGTLAAAESLTAARLQREYEIDVMNRQAAELDAAATQAAAERNAANARVTAMQAAANAASVRVSSAAALVAAFDDQRFTPDVWHALGERMSHLARRYLGMALDIAKRMQRSYNFENDVQRAIIKADYSTEAVHGLLAADALMADVQSFTYDLITSTAPKPQPVRQTISLSQRYPFLFETQLRATGTMEFQTTIDDFDSRYPGSYAGRIEHVEVEIDGIVPPRGVSGTLTNAGISHYRMPAALWPPNSSGLKHRVQSRETLVLSDFDVRADAIIVDSDRRRRRIFEGAGTASSWTLELPRDVNEIDYSSIVDVRLTFSYEARFDPDLKGQVLADLAARPSVHERQRPLPLRWLYPDAFFAFYNTGDLSLSLDAGDFASYELDPRLTELSLIVATSPRARASGITLEVTSPGGAPVQVVTDGDGIVPTNAMPVAAGTDAIGPYRIVLNAAANPGWTTAGQLDLDAIQNIALVVGYSFTPRN